MPSSRVPRRTGFAVVAGRARHRRRNAQRDASPAGRDGGAACPPGYVSAERAGEQQARENAARRSTGCAPVAGARPADRAAGTSAASRNAPERRRGAAHDPQRLRPPRARRPAPSVAAAPTRPPCAQARADAGGHAARRRPAPGSRSARARWSPTIRASTSVNGLGAGRPQRADRRLRLRRRRTTACSPPSARAACGASDDRGASWRSIGDSAADPGRRQHRLHPPAAARSSIAHRRQRLRRRRHVRRPRRLPLHRRRRDVAAARPGVPSGVIAFKVAADPTTRASSTRPPAPGLFRSTDARRELRQRQPADAARVRRRSRADRASRARWPTWSPTSSSRARRRPTPTARRARSLAAVGWRAGRQDRARTATSRRPATASTAPTPARPARSPRPAAFAALAPGRRSQPGRIELGAATGPDAGPPLRLRARAGRREVHRRVRARRARSTLAGAARRRSLGGIYVSSDFGADAGR